MLSRLIDFGRWGQLVAAALLLVVLVDLRLAWRTQMAEAQAASGAYEVHQVDADAYYAPTAGQRFLQTMTATHPARIVGYAQHIFGGPLPYTLRWMSPRVVALGVNNRAILAGLYDVQGYNPIHLARFDAYMRVLNGQAQEYHQTDVLESGLIDPRRTVILENGATAQAAQDELLGPDPTPDESVSWEQSLLESGGDSVLLHVHAAAPGWLVLSDAYYPAWQARVDGSPRRVEIADAALRAVAVPGGDHSVEFLYNSPALAIGAALSGLTVLSLA